MIIKRKEAKKKGLSKYFTGKECKNGHIDSRYTINGICLSCFKSITTKYLNNKLKNYGEEKYYFTGKPCKHGHLSKRLVINRRCYECSQLADKKFYKTERGKELKSKQSSLYYQRNKDKLKQKVKIYKKNNKGIVNSLKAKRKAMQLKATPIWSNLEIIKEIYINCPDGMQVDHIIPLQGKIVCGFHIPENLQYLTPEENQIKGRKLKLGDKQ